MKKIYFILLFLSFSVFISAQDMGGTPVLGLIPITRTDSPNQSSKTLNTTSEFSATSEMQSMAATTTPTGNSSEVGTTEGQLSVSLSGSATYNIPIVVPPGINGVVPQISLTYNSQGGSGLAGYGWNIAGISKITRIPSTKFHDGIIDGVDFDNLDRFALDGQRLIVKNGTYGASGTVYETESFSNVKITSYGVHPSGATYGPAYFFIEYPDGSKAYYGNSTDSRSIMEYAITYWENPQGVRISYTYNNTNNVLNIATINYGTLGAATPINKIQFNYNTANRPKEFYVGGQKILQDKILNNIVVTGNSIGFRSYWLAYNTNSTGYQRLISITEKSADGVKSYNPTVFSYENTADSISYANITTSLSVGNITSLNAGTVSGDFGGDEKMEFLIYPTTGTSSKAKYWLFSDISSGNYTNIGYEHAVGAFESIFPTTWLSWNNHLMPKHGWTVAKKTDTNYTFTIYSSSAIYPILYQYERTVNFPIQSSGSSCYPNKIIPKNIISGDFNGDGLTDVIAIDNTCSSKKVYFVDLKSDNTTNFLTYSGELASIITTSSKVEVADVNGDGKSDFMVFENGKVTSYSLNDVNQLVLLWNYSDTNISVATTKTILLGDYNGDGKTDFIIPNGYGSTTWYKYTSRGTGFIKTTQTYSGISFLQNDSYNTYNYIASDYEKDGKTDLILTKSNRNSGNTSGILTITSYKNSNGTFSSSSSVTASCPTNSDIYLNALPIYLPTGKGIQTKDKPYNPTLEIAFLSNNKIFYFNSTKDNTQDQLLRSITTGNGVTESITYKPLNSDYDENYNTIYGSSYSEVYPNSNIESASSIQVVSMLEKQSTTDYKKQLYSYYDAISNTEGLGFLGFRASMRTNWFNDNNLIISSISKFEPNLRSANTANYTYLGLVGPEAAIYTPAPIAPRTSAISINNTRTTTETVQATNRITFLPGATISPTGTNTFVAQITPDYDANGFVETNTTPPYDLISKSLSFYDSNLSATKVFKLQNTQSNAYNILENTSSETVTVYDDYNNPIESISKIRNGGAGEQTTISTIAYQSPSSTPYVVGRPTSKKQSVNVTGDTTTSEELYDYTNQLLTQVKKKGHNTEYITEDNTYDGFGNITKKTISATGLTPRVTNYEYDTSGRFLTKSKDIEGLATTYSYNSANGVLNSETNPYGLTTSYTI